MFSIGRELTAEQRLHKATIAIMGHPRYVALAGVLMIGSKTVSDDEEDCPTAYTNGRDEVYGRGFVDGLTDPELRGLVLHETYHKMKRHSVTWQHLDRKNPKLSNIAKDYNINADIVHENRHDGFAQLPEGGCHDPRFYQCDVADIFNTLEDENDMGLIDPDNIGQLDEHHWDGENKLSADEEQELMREIDQAIRQGAMAAGKMGGYISPEIEALLEPQIDWREALREFLHATCAGKDYSTWSRPNRRYVHMGIYMPSGISEVVQELVIAVDTSGSSVGTKEQTAYMSEVASVCAVIKPQRVRILYWDTSIMGEEIYDQEQVQNIINTTKPRGGGGTSVSCVTNYINENKIKADAVLILTDGYLGGDWGKDWASPVLWCVVDNKHAKPKVGQVLHIKSGEMI